MAVPAYAQLKQCLCLRSVICVQAEDDLAEKMRSNEMLLKAVNTYREASELPDTPPDLIKATLKKRADRQQFLGKHFPLTVVIVINY